ncbi:MAG: hypothetical protein AB7W16_07810 [Candidatus Obscuribacterales bacterium]
MDQVFSKKVDPEGHLQEFLEHLDQVFSENLDPDDQVSWSGYDIPVAQHPPGSVLPVCVFQSGMKEKGTIFREVHSRIRWIPRRALHSCCSARFELISQTLSKQQMMSFEISKTTENDFSKDIMPN